MQSRSRLAEIFLMLCLLMPRFVLAELIRIDDLTVQDPATGQIFTVPVVQPETAPLPPTSATPRAMTDGYVVCTYSNDCSPFDLISYALGTVIELSPEGNYPYDATLNPAGTELWIPGASGDHVLVIDRVSNTVTHRILVAEYPTSLAFSADGSVALVPSRDSEEVTIIDTVTYTVIGHLPILTNYLGAGNIALNPVSENFFMVDWYANQLYEIAPDGSEVLRQVVAGIELWQLVVAPDGQFIYITDRETDEVRVIDPATLTQVRTFSVGADPWGIDITADGSKLVVACEDGHQVDIVNTGTGEVTAVALDGTADPRDVDILDSEQAAYVAGGQVTGGSNPVYLISLTTDTLKDTFESGGSNANVVAVQPQMGGNITAIDDRLPSIHMTLSAYPNPFNPRTQITYTVDEASTVELAIYDLEGQRIQVLASGWCEAGGHEVSWDGLDRHGRQASSGIYFLRLGTGLGVASLKLALMK